MYAKEIRLFRDLLFHRRGELSISLNDAAGDKPGGPAISRVVQQTFLDQLADLEGVSTISIANRGRMQRTVIDGKKLKSSRVFAISVQNEANVVLKNLEIVQLDASGRGVLIENCKVLRLSCRSLRGVVEIKNSEIGQVNAPGATPFFEIRFLETKVIGLFLDENFSCREVKIDEKTKFSRTIIAKDLSGFIGGRPSNPAPYPDRQSFAYLHDWATAAGNTRVAHIARGNELAIEKSLSHGFEWVVLSLWQAFADFGLKPLRPLLWILFLYASFSVLLLWSGTSLGSDSGSYNGWRSVLVAGQGFEMEISRALVGAAEGIVSPFSVFNVRRLIVPNEPWVATLQVFYNYFCIVMLFLFGFSVRRRFKVG